MCQTGKTSEQLSSSNGYTITEEEFVKFVILSICDNVNDGFIHFEKLEENEKFIEQIVGEIYGRNIENAAKILSFINVVPAIDLKYLMIVAFYDQIMLKEDVTGLWSFLSVCIGNLYILFHFSGQHDT